MGIKYSTLSLEERLLIQQLCEQNLSAREIGRQLNRATSTITRELTRNLGDGQSNDHYSAAKAMGSYTQRRRAAKAPLRKLGANFESPLGQEVVGQLKQSWSPQQISGKLKSMDTPQQQSVSHETIYQGIYLLPRGQLRSELIDCLRRARAKRMPRSRGKARANIIPNLVGIEQRPAEANSRDVPGHWEADFVKGAYNRSAIGTMIERTSRRVLLAHLDGCTAQDALEGFTRRLLTVPQELRKTFAYDRGVEMVLHEQLTQRTGIAVYFCDPHSPWQRACNENLNGLVREFLPKGTDLSTVSYQELSRIEQLINNRPRAILGFKTPNEVYQEIIDKLNLDKTSTPTMLDSGDNGGVALQG